jgi:hypothetical protein
MFVRMYAQYAGARKCKKTLESQGILSIHPHKHLSEWIALMEA